MYVRLAFAVAAHLEPEILIVDEVLAVGDAAFQKKCLGKMGEVAEKEGRTVLFVSHNIVAMKSLCRQGIWLEKGKILCVDNIKKVTSSYLAINQTNQSEKIWNTPKEAPGNEEVRLHKVSVYSSIAENIQKFTILTPITVKFEYWNWINNSLLNVSYVIYTIDNICVFNSFSEPQEFPVGLVKSICFIPENFLNNGTYKLRVLIVKNTSTVILDLEDVIFFEIHDVERSGNWYGEWIGTVRPKLDWLSEVKELAMSN
jgi:lipopolysaccharide transport system ATP-binding protein